jgi:hypothetical protein
MGKGIWIALAVAAAALLAGCGSASNDGSTQTATISKAKFDKRMESLCEHSEEEKFEKIGIAAHEGMWPKHGEPTKEDLEKITTAVIVPVFKHMTTRMQEMPLPRGSEKKVEAIIATFEGDVRKMETDPSRFVEGIAFEDGNTAAGALGLVQCSF